MTNEEMILQLLQGMQGDVKEIKQDLSGVKQELSKHSEELAELRRVQAQHSEELAELRRVQAQHSEELGEIREKMDEFQVCIDTLLAWADDAQGVVKVPFAKGIQPKEIAQ